MKPSMLTGLIRQATQRAPRPYQIVVLSDHGQTQGATFLQRYGVTLEEIVARACATSDIAAPANTDDEALGRIGVARTDGFAHCPDIVNSTYWPELEEVAAFEELVGSHGGRGRPQSFPFLLAPAGFEWPAKPLVGAEAVHRVLRGWLADLCHAGYREEAAA